MHPPNAIYLHPGLQKMGGVIIIIISDFCFNYICEGFLWIDIFPHLIFFHQHLFWKGLGIAVDELHDIVVTLV